MRVKRSECSKSLKLTTCVNFPDPKLQVIRKEQVWQVLRASLTVATYAEKYPRVQNFVLHPLPRRQDFFGTNKWRSVWADCFQLCTAMPSCYVGHYDPISSRHPSFYPRYSHGRKPIQKNTLKCSRSQSNGTLHYYTLQMISKTWTTLTEAANLARLRRWVQRKFCGFRDESMFFAEKAGTWICTLWAVASSTS